MTLLSKLNVDQLDKLTQNSELLMWGIEGLNHYINDRHLMIRINTLDMEENEDAWELSDFLENKFGRKPIDGQTLVFHYGEVKEGKHHAKEIAEKFMTNIPSTEGIVTPFLYSIGSFRYRWIDFDGFNSFVNDDFTSLLYESESQAAYAAGSESPLYLCGGDMMILPVKNMGNRVSDSDLDLFSNLIKDILEDTVSTEQHNEVEAV